MRRVAGYFYDAAPCIYHYEAHVGHHTPKVNLLADANSARAGTAYGQQHQYNS